MTKFLNKLITEETPVIRLNYQEITNEQKKEALNLQTSLADTYIKNMYLKDGNWFYFKQDTDNYGYPFYIIDELMGSYLAKKRLVPSVFYNISLADVKHHGEMQQQYGIASIDFKDKNHEYYMLSDLLDENIDYDFYKIDFLRDLCINKKCEQNLLEQLFKSFALDIYMLQKDRCNVNLQFQLNKKTSEISLAPLYDFSNCLPRIGLSGLDSLKNVIVDLTDLTIPKLCREYPQFKEELIYWLDQSMSEVWDIICRDYSFNQDTMEYQMIKDYYEIKEESVKKYLKQMIKDIQK